jgi:cytoskeletal protein CcmA (bactofilin family)
MSNGTHRIASGTRFAGALRGSGDLTIEGAAEGSVSLDGALECTASAACSLEVEATTVRIAGEFSGTIDARARVELLASARVTASVRSPVFVMAEGAVFRGAIEMPEPVAPAVASAKPAPTTPTPAKPAFAPKAELMATTVDPSSPVVADGAGAVGDVPAEEQAAPPDATAAEASESDSSTEPAEKAPAKRRTSRGAKS